MDNKDLLKQYVTIGQALPYGQFMKIEKNPSLYKSYMRSRNIAVQNDRNDKLETYELPDEELVKIKEINFGSQGLIEIPTFIYKTKELKYLYLDKNNLSNIPEILIDHLSNSNIIVLALNSNNITSLPENIGNLKSLRNLELTNNQLTTLPQSFGSLEKLRDLYLLYNNLTSLPESIGSLQQLEYLNLQENQLTTLPKSFVNLKNLGYLNLRDNPISQEYVDRLRTLLPNCEIIFEYK